MVFSQLSAQQSESAGTDAAALSSADLTAAEIALAETADFLKRTKEVPDQLESVQAEIATLQEGELKEVPSGLGTKELQKIRDSNRVEIESFDLQLQTLDQEERRRTSRLIEIPEQVERLRARTRPLVPAAGGAPDPQGEEPPVQPSATEADQSRAAQIQSLLAEQSFYEIASPLFEARRLLLRLRKDRADSYHKDVMAVLSRSIGDAAVEARKTGREILLSVDASVTLRKMEERTLELIDGRSTGELAQNRSRLDHQLGKERRLLSQAQEMAAAGERKIALLEEAGVPIDPTTGELLRRHKASLPSAAVLKHLLREGSRHSAQLQLLALDLASENTSSLDPALDTQLEEEARRHDLDPEIADRILARHREALAESTALARDLAGRQASLNVLYTQTAAQVERYTAFIHERIIWIRNVEPLGLSALGKEVEGVKRGLKSPVLLGAPGRIAADFSVAPLGWFGAFLLLLLLVTNCRKLLATICAAGKEAERYRCLSVAPTFRSLGCSLLLPTLVSGPLAYVGWRLLHSNPGGALGTALLHMAAVLLPGGFVWLAMHPKGLFVKHFGGDVPWVARLRRIWAWTFPPLLAVVAVTTYFAHLAPVATYGRAPFLVELIVIAVLAILMLRADTKSGRRLPIPHLILPLLLIVLLALGIFTALGYFDSALGIRSRIFYSFLAVVGVHVLRSMLTRGLTVAKRREVREQIVRRREALVALRDAETGKEKEDSKPIPTKEEMEADELRLVHLEEQTHKVLRFATVSAILAALGVIWFGLLPAVSSLDDKVVWTVQKAGESVVETPSGLDAVIPGISEEVSSSGVGSSVSLLDVLLAVFGLAVTLVLSGSLPAMIEILFLRRLAIGAGASFATTSIIRYVILIGGVLLSLRMIAFDWSSIQWIAAAASLGIGFGLQEIFANFVSGIILLLERPVRLGDLVTIGTDSGKVSKISMRATTILQFNNRELVIPNKSLVTGNLVNWTLTDPMMRLEVPVGVAYGSDTEQVRDILLNVAREHASVLKEPKPSVIFSEFGDSSLNFVVRFFVSTITDVVPVPSELHYIIDKRFREAGIEIPFPQRDLHVKTGASPEVVSSSS